MKIESTPFYQREIVESDKELSSEEKANILSNALKNYADIKSKLAELKAKSEKQAIELSSMFTSEISNWSYMENLYMGKKVTDGTIGLYKEILKDQFGLKSNQKLEL